MKLRYFILPFLLSGCGGYYAKENYFQAIKSKQWNLKRDRLAVYTCNDQKLEVYVRSFLYSITSHAVLGVPVLPENEKPTKQNSLSVMLDFKTKKNVHCSNSDIKLSSKSKIFNAKFELAGYNINKLVHCDYRFKVDLSDLDEISLIFSEKLLGCNIPPLKLVKQSKHGYNFQPW